MQRTHTSHMTIICLLAGFIFIVPARAEEMTGLGVGAKISTLGIGGEVLGSINENLNLRLGLQGFTYDHDDSYAGNDYNVELELFTGMLLADWFPFGNNFRISAGAMINQNEVILTGEPTNGTFNIGGVTFPAAAVGTLKGTADFNSVAPYLGIGYGGSFSDTSNWSFFCDLGVLFQGSPNLTYTASGPISTYPPFQVLMERERQQIEDDVDEYQYYPVVSLGVTYKF